MSTTVCELIKKKGKRLVVDKGEEIFTQGNSDSGTYFLETGLLKAYYPLPDGREYVKSFVEPGGLICSINASYKKSFCTFNLFALKPSLVFEYPYEAILEETNRSPAIAEDLIEKLTQVFLKKELREYEFLCLSAEERYEILIDKQPNLIDEVSQLDIARYLGITPVGLSRIKKRVESKIRLLKPLNQAQPQ